MSSTSIKTPRYSKKVTDMILYVVAKQLADKIIASPLLSEKYRHQKHNKKKKMKHLQPA